MLDHGVDPNFIHHTIFSSKRKEIVTALHIAVDLGLYDTVQVSLTLRLLVAGPKINIQCTFCNLFECLVLVTLHYLVNFHLQVLLDANADCNICDHNQETPLHIGVKKADRIIVRMLLSRGADPSIPDRRWVKCDKCHSS